MGTEFKDSFTLNINANIPKSLPKGQRFRSSMRPIVGSNGIFWAVHGYRDEEGDARVYLWISKHEKLSVRWEYRLGNVRCDFTFCNFKRDATFVPFAINDFVRDFNYYTPDAKIVVDDKTFDVHRHLLCVISPVFQAEFAHDAEESKSGTIKITGFDFKTIKNVIDYCYGRDHEIKTVLDCINLLRFADKYDIRTITNTFEPLLYDFISLRSFCGIAEYAWNCERKDLQSKCAQFYKNNIAQIGLTPSFANMSPSTLVGIISAASLLDTPNAAGTDATDQLNEPIRRVSEINAPTVHNFTTYSDHYPTDAQVVVGNRRIDVHRHYLSMLSPVFYEKFMENKTGTIHVNDFDFSTVKNVIDYCYGKKTTIEMSASNQKLADFLRFGHKYSIPITVDEAEQALLDYLSKDNFCSVVRYAWECEKAELKLKCAEFYRNYNEYVQFTPDFLKMDGAIIRDILRQAASVKKLLEK